MILSRLIIICLIIKQSASNVPKCKMEIVESIPENLTYESKQNICKSTATAWKEIINNTESYLKINSFYWSLMDNANFPSSKLGEQILEMILNKSKSVKLLINQDFKMSKTYPKELELLKKNHVNISIIDVTRLIGAGVQHSKIWISDGTAVYIGSANMDWRSLTQIKEAGIHIVNCPDIVYDIEKFWNNINYLSGSNSTVPDKWSTEFSPRYNHTSPLNVLINDVPMLVYTATSPPPFNPLYRTSDYSAVIDTINKAKSFIWICVMNFEPIIKSYEKRKQAKYWPDFENILIKMAFEKSIEVRLLIGRWEHSSKYMFIFLKSLAYLAKSNNLNQKINIKVKYFIVPAFNNYQRNLNFSRVNHCKYMVTDNSIYIGTSNWSGDYFEKSVGISFVAIENCTNKCNKESIRMKLEKVFERDWNSVYSHNVDC